MKLSFYEHAIDIQQYFSVKILYTVKGGWMCTLGKDIAFLPGSQLYDNIYDYNSYEGKIVKVLIQKVDERGIVVSHKDYVNKIKERSIILNSLERGQKLIGVVKGIVPEGYQIDVLGIIGFMYKNATVDDKPLNLGQTVEVAVAKSDIAKSILKLSAKLLQQQETKPIPQQIVEELSRLKVGDKLCGHIVGFDNRTYQIVFPNGIVGLLSKEEIPYNYKVEENTDINVCISSIDMKKGLLFVSVKKLIHIYRLKVRKYLENDLTSNEEFVGKVVFIEKELVTIHIPFEDDFFSGYIKKDDLSWEKIQNAHDMVFLGEELKVKFIYYDKGKPYFDLKWQQIDLYPSELFELDTDELLNTIGITENRFIAKASIIKKKSLLTEDSEEIVSAFANNFIALGENDDHNHLFDKYTGANITAIIPLRYAYGLIDGSYYIFKLKVANLAKRRDEHRPYMFEAILDGGALIMKNPFKELVEKSFKENKTPKSNRESASYLKEIGADMYTDRDRMFYELLQNADDASSVRGVKVMVQIKDDYLIFTHDGLSFSRQDFRSIVSTANSTKRLDRKKTGYKGIGFKSVFTDSEKVYIKTGGFFFVFDKQSELFKNFRNFYRYVNPLYTEEQLQIFFEENSEYENEFEGVDHLPWQLLPFWVDECPAELLGTTFSRNCNVAIALNMGVTAEKYRDVIKGIIQNPRFMLFLRNTRRIQLEEPSDEIDDKKRWNIISIAKNVECESGITTLKNSFESNEKEISYIVREGDEIPVSNDSFENSNIPLIKECKELAGREKWYMYQIIDNLPIPITSIPERIIAADTTTVSYAFMLDEKGRSVCIPDKTPSLYAYLPMEDRRYLFPFFINADFELSSNRQEAKRVSVWNEFLFYHIGKNIVSWVASIATPSHPSYLSLLPSSYFVEELEEGKIDRLALQFNRGYKESLLEIPFILNDKLKIVCQDDIVIDESGFAAVIGPDDFCNLIGTEKRMLHKDIVISPLTNREIFTKIEHIQTNKVVDTIINPQNRIQILRYWCSISPTLRTSILTHIVNMPGNKKNLNDSLLDIPAYSCMGRLYSFNKLLKSKSIIIRCEFIKGIENIIEKLGFKITDENEVDHPFHSNTEEAMNGYSIHVFEIIRSRTSEKSNPITASEKYNLFYHFTSSKRNIDHDTLKDWPLFCNQLGYIVPLSHLTHIDSSLYNNITRRFVIDEIEYNLGSRVIDRYLMKEKDQYENIVVKNWELLISEVGGIEEKACSLYKLTTITYSVAEHEQAKDKQLFPLQGKKIIFANEQMFLLSEVFVNDKLSIDSKCKALVEELTGKNVPSLIVSNAIQLVPFGVKNQSIESITILPNTVQTQEQVDTLLQFCASTDDTVFTKYSLDKKEDSYVYSELVKGTVVAYTNNSILKSFILSNCRSIKLIPDEFSKFHKLNGVCYGDDLLLRILDVLMDIKSHEQVLLPIYMNSISKIKTSYLFHLSSIYLNEDSCKDKNDINIQTFLLASTIEKPGNDLFEHLRNKIYITQSGVTTPLSSIKMEHSVEINGKQYPLSKLLPNEDKLAKLVDTLRERIEEYIPVVFTNKLFGFEIDSGRSATVFTALNKQNVVLENGAQMAFVLEYAVSKKLRLLCKVQDSVFEPGAHLLNRLWILKNHSFMNQVYILNDKYGDLIKYVKLPYSNSTIQCNIQQDIVNFEHIKESLSDKEICDLLDVVAEKKSSNMVISVEDVSRIKHSIGIADHSYVISEKFSLQDEKLPKSIDQWRTLKEIDNRTTLLCDLFGVISEDSDIVRVRTFFESNMPLVVSQKDDRISDLTCKWISQKSIMVNDNQFLHLQDVLDDNDYVCEQDTDALIKHISPDFHFMSFGDYNIYLFKGEIPWKAKLSNYNYVFHQYNEGDIALCGYDIFINEKQIENITDLIQSLVNTEGFSAEDFLSFFKQYQSKVRGSLEGEIDDDLDSDARSAASEMAKQEAINWLSAKGYDTSHVQTEYSFVNGVKKNSVEYHIVVKSFRTKTKELKINPNEWLYLLKANSRLMLYMKHMSFAVIDREMLLGNHDFLKLRISASNFRLEGNRLDETLSKLANDIQYFERTHFVFEHVHDNILSRANSLEDYGLYGSNSNEQFTSANEDDIL